MELEALLNKPEYALPARNTTGRPFVTFFEETVRRYLSDINSSPDLLSSIPAKLLDYRELVDTLSHLAFKTIEVLKLVLRNANADGAFAAMMEESFLQSNMAGSVCVIRKTDALYRSRIVKAGMTAGQDYFFHTPFHLNHKVRSTRFSPPGIPSLYLSNCVVLSYLEMGAPPLDDFYAVKFQTCYPETFLDIDCTKPDVRLKVTDRAAYEEQLQTKAIMFPLLLACSTLRQDTDAAAPQEYIVPQMLTRWIASVNKLLLGIRYNTTKISRTDSSFVGRFNNYIVPVRKYENEGFCAELKNKFNMGPVCAAKSDRPAIDDYFNREFYGKGFVNKDVLAINWKGSMVNYDMSETGRVEFYMKHAHPAGRITF